MDATATPQLKRPVQVTVAVWLIIYSGVIFLTKAIFLADWKDPWSFLTVPLMLSFLLIWIYPILRRRNWARWVVSVGTFLCCWQAAGHLHKNGLNWEAGEKLLIIGALIETLVSWVKVFLLFSKPANDWFRTSTPPKTETPPNPS